MVESIFDDNKALVNPGLRSAAAAGAVAFRPRAKTGNSCTTTRPRRSNGLIPGRGPAVGHVLSVHPGAAFGRGVKPPGRRNPVACEAKELYALTEFFTRSLFSVRENLLISHTARGASHGFCRPCSGIIEVTFANTGDTIPAEDLALIFERFYGVDKSRSRDSGGTGIGLAIVKELVEAHGGQVGADSSGGYIRVWFTLPV